MPKAPKHFKDYKKWHNLKSQIEKTGKEKYFHDQEIWWCSIGVNVGFRQILCDL